MVSGYATNQSLLKESLEQIELSIREKLAQEIEKEMVETEHYDALNKARLRGLKRAAYIVRGGKKVG